MNAADDEARFRALFERHYGAVLGYATRRTDDSGAQDVVAETFTTAWRRLAVVPDEPATLPWLLVTARHTLANHRRGQWRWARLLTRMRPIDVEPASAPVERAAEHGAVRAAIAQLKPADREVLLLALWDELPHDQIGAVLGCSVGAVGVRLHRAKARLRDRLEPSFADAPAPTPLAPNGVTR